MKRRIQFIKNQMLNIQHLARLVLLTDSWNSGSFAEASQRLFSMNILGFDSFCETVWKNCFSALVIVDSAFNTNTKTSAFKQWLSIQSSRLAETSTPGESTKTTSSRSRLQRSRGQKMRTKELSLSFSWHKAFANCLMFCNIKGEKQLLKS